MIVDNTIFIHIPRCGGTSVELAFRNITGHHQGWEWYADSFSRSWNNINCFKFAFIRHPFDRILSLWRYWNNVGKADWFVNTPQMQHTKDNQEGLFRLHVHSLDDMLDRIIWLRGQEWTDGHFLEQADYLPKHPAHEGIYIYRLGDPHAWTEICANSDAKLPAIMPRKNKSPSNSIKLSVNQEKVVGSLFPRDLELCRSTN